MKEKFLDLKRELGTRFRRANVFISWQDWAAIQYGTFELNGADKIRQNLAQNTIAAAYNYEGVTGALLGTLDYGRNALQRINEVLSKSDVASFMEMARGEDGSYVLMPKPEYKGRVTIQKVNDQSDVFLGMQIDLKRELL
jgi:hypothetical protein